MANLERAIEIAGQAHRGQVQRNGQPYILHPLHLMLSVETDVEKVTAVLHDVVEDSTWTLEDLRREGFAPEVLDALALLTHAKDVPYDDYVERLASNPIARRVKLADLRHNMDFSRLQAVGPKDLARMEKYHRAWARLTNRS